MGEGRITQLSELLEGEIPQVGNDGIQLVLLQAHFISGRFI
jgi:hypothetical protein